MSTASFARRCLTACAVAVVAAGAFSGTAGAAASSQQRFIVVLESKVKPQKTAREHAKRHGLKIGHVYRSALRGYSAVVPPGKLRKLNKDVRVNYVVRDTLVSGVPSPGRPSLQGDAAREFGVGHIPENNLPPQAAPVADPQGVPFGGDGPADEQGGAIEGAGHAEDAPGVKPADPGEQAVEGAGKPAGGGGGTTGGGQTVPTGINRIDSELSSQVSGNGSGAVSVAVAVFDTGSGPHTDLNVAGGVNCVPRTKGTTDLQGHGTHVAGIIGAKDDGAGVVGVAPGARIYSVRVLGTSITGTLSDLLCGLDWLNANSTSMGIKVANLSLEMTRTGATSTLDDDCDASIGDLLHDAICRVVAKGVTVVAAGGNYAKELANTTPAAYDDVLTVNAMADFDGLPGGLGVNPSQCEADGDDSSAAFSNWASDSGTDRYHTVAAPGRCLNSTWKGGGYNLQSGTSFAAPHVAGLVALCIHGGACAGLTPRGVIQRIHADASSMTSGYGFADDPNSAVSGRWYGPLVSADPY